MKQFQTTFKDSESHTWTVKLTTAVTIRFAGQENLNLDEILPENLNAEQMVRLVWLGIQHHVDIKHGFDYEGFLNVLEGEALTDAVEAGGLALINFILNRLPENKRPQLQKIVQKGLDEKERLLAQDGDGTSIPIA